MPFTYERHGGQCCGISHVLGFYNSTIAELDEVLRQHDRDNDHGAAGNRLLEAVLTNRQLYPERGRDEEQVAACVAAAGGWGNVLAAKGFKLVQGFVNSNSGRTCYVFHRVSRPIDLSQPLPFTMDANGLHNAPAPAPAPAPVGHRREDLLVGGRFRYMNRTDTALNQYVGLEGEITDVTDYGIRVRFDNGLTATLGSWRNVVPIEAPAVDAEPAPRRFAVGARVVENASLRIGTIVEERANNTYVVRMEDSNRTRLILENGMSPARPQQPPQPRPARVVEEPVARDRGGVVVTTQYRSVFRDGRRGILRATPGACMEANPRCNRIDRVETLDNGDERITENWRR